MYQTALPQGVWEWKSANGIAVFRQADFPRYFPGLWTTIALNLACMACCGFMSMYFIKKNRQAREGLTINEGLVDFHYTI